MSVGKDKGKNWGTAREKLKNGSPKNRTKSKHKPLPGYKQRKRK